MATQLTICEHCRLARARSYRDIDHECLEFNVTQPTGPDGGTAYCGPQCDCTCSPETRHMLRRIAPRKACWLHPDHTMILCNAASCAHTKHWFCDRTVTPGTLHLAPRPRTGIVNAV